jgi:hypothetical protein
MFTTMDRLRAMTNAFGMASMDAMGTSCTQKYPVDGVIRPSEHRQ